VIQLGETRTRRARAVPPSTKLIALTNYHNYLIALLPLIALRSVSRLGETRRDADAASLPQLSRSSLSCSGEHGQRPILAAPERPSQLSVAAMGGKGWHSRWRRARRAAAAKAAATILAASVLCVKRPA
jgi:hypothetical protein